MSIKLLTRQPTGFTIVEVLIAVAAGGLILLITLQAIPTLQRNSRNNQRKQDVTAILEAVSRYESNNSGDFPDECGTGVSKPLCKDVFLNVADLHYYNEDNAVNAKPYNPLKQGELVTSTNTLADNETVYVRNYRRCQSDPGSGAISATPAAAGYFDVVAMYMIERGSNTYSFHCQQL